MMEGSAGRLPEGMTTVKLTAGMSVGGVTLLPGTDVPCFASSQLIILKHGPNASYHLLSGLYAWACQADRGEQSLQPHLARLAAANFPMPAVGNAPALPSAVARAGGMVLCAVQGNIALAATEVIVNAANDQLQMGGGVAGAIRSRGGIELEVESRSHAPARMGDIVRTSAGKLKARELYHAVVIEYTTMNRTEMSDVESSFTKVLETALEERVSSVAVPFLGCGVGGLSVQDVAGTYLSAARRVGAEKKRGMLVLLVVYGEEDAAKVAETFASSADPDALAKTAEDFLKEAQRLLGHPEEP
jgi:O-acetyl-ADP-ribose deacetylase